MVKHEQALETRDAGYCETNVGSGLSRFRWGGGAYVEYAVAVEVTVMVYVGVEVLQD